MELAELKANFHLAINTATNELEEQTDLLHEKIHELNYTAELNLPQCFHVLQSATKNVIEDAASRVENHILNVLNKKNKNNTS